MSVKTEVLTDVVRLYELTHGPTYLVFKYQLFTSPLLRGETPDYTEAKPVVKRTSAKFLMFLT